MRYILLNCLAAFVVAVALALASPAAAGDWSPGSVYVVTTYSAPDPPPSGGGWGYALSQGGDAVSSFWASYGSSYGSGNGGTCQHDRLFGRDYARNGSQSGLVVYVDLYARARGSALGGYSGFGRGGSDNFSRGTGLDTNGSAYKSIDVSSSNQNGAGDDQSTTSVGLISLTADTTVKARLTTNGYAWSNGTGWGQGDGSGTATWRTQ